jgi:hypothetical protein
VPVDKVMWRKEVYLYELLMSELATCEYMKPWKEVEVYLLQFLISDLYKCDWIKLCEDVNTELSEYLTSAPDRDDPAKIPTRNRLPTSVEKGTT